MSNRYDDLAKLNELRASGALTEEEYQAEKQKILSGRTSGGGPYWGMEEQQYVVFMHLAQLAGFVIPFAGMVLPIVMWAVYRDQSATIDVHGRHIVNWLLSALIYGIVFFFLSFLLIGIPFLIALFIAGIVFCIIGAIKANAGIAWRYPLSQRFL